MENEENLAGQDSTQHYNLKWTNYVNNILLVFAENLNNELLTDVTLTCEGKFIKAHKILLSACSSYFHQLFQVYLVPNPLIILNGVRYNDLRQIIQYIYQGEIKVTEHDIDSILALAENLQIKGLCNIKFRNKIEENLRKSVAKVSYHDKNENVSDDTMRNKRKRTMTPILSESKENEDSASGNSSEKFEWLAKRPKLTPFSVSRSPTNYNNDAFQKLNQKLLMSPKTADTISNNNLSTQPESTASSADVHYPKVIVKIPQPRNAFMIFANEFRKQMAADHPDETNKAISIRLGAIWKKLPRKTRLLYYNAAKQANQEYKSKYPSHFYSPKIKENTSAKKQDLNTNLSNFLPESNSSAGDMCASVDDYDDDVEFIGNIKEEIEVEQTCINSYTIYQDTSDKS